MINMPFSAERGEVIAEAAFYTQPWFWDIVKQVLGVLFILVLVFGVLPGGLMAMCRDAILRALAT